MKQLEVQNRIIPIVGDFSGEQALESVGRYLKNHQATVSAFYTSNVEFYLFQSEDWKRFFHNVAGLPLDTNSVFKGHISITTAFGFRISLWEPGR